MLGIKESIKEIMKNIISINNNKLSVNKFKNIYCTKHDLTSSTKVSMASSSWTINDYSVYMVGSILQVYFYASVSTNYGAGDLTNTDVLTFNIAHGGKIGGAYSVSEVCRSSTGHLAGIIYTYGAVDENNCTVKVTLANAHSGGATLRGLALLPARINLSAY